MTYFNKFPSTTYELAGDVNIVQDILRRSAFISEYKPYTDLYTPYTIIDGETPQSIAKRMYGAATYHWVVLMFNELHNPYHEWPVEPLTLKNICIDKYGEDVMYMTRHNEKDGDIVGEIKTFVKGVEWVPPELIPSCVPVSFYEYEEALNHEKRFITLLRPELLGEFIKQFGSSISK